MTMLSEVNLGDTLLTKAKGLKDRARDAAIHAAGRTVGLDTPAAKERLSVRVLADKLHNYWRGYLSGARYSGNKVEGNLDDLHHFIVNYLGLGQETWNAPAVQAVIQKMVPDISGENSSAPEAQPQAQPVSQDQRWAAWWDKQMSPQARQLFMNTMRMPAGLETTEWNSIPIEVRSRIMQVAKSFSEKMKEFERHAAQPLRRPRRESAEPKGQLLEAQLNRSVVDEIFKAVAGYQLHMGYAGTTYAMSKAERKAAASGEEGNTAHKKPQVFNPDSWREQRLTLLNFSHAFKTYRNFFDHNAIISIKKIETTLKNTTGNSSTIRSLLANLGQVELQPKAYALMLFAVDSHARQRMREATITPEAFEDAVHTSDVAGKLKNDDVELVSRVIESGNISLERLLMGSQIPTMRPPMFITLLYAAQRTQVHKAQHHVSIP